MRRTLWLLFALGVVGFSWWEGGLHRNSTGAHLGVVISIGFLGLGGGLRAMGHHTTTSLEWARGPLGLRRHLAADRAGTLGAIAWVSLFAVTIGWDLFSFTEQRHDLPTLSALIGDVTSYGPGRAGVFALWLLLGTALANGWWRR